LVPHAPQLALSEETTTHLPLQSVSPVWHEVAHFPAEQTSPLEHLAPHPPQLALSLDVSTHVPSQSTDFPRQVEDSITRPASGCPDPVI
jgi:hypothetical protein